MKIADSQVNLAAAHSRTEITKEHERLEVWQRGAPTEVSEGEGGQMRLQAEAMVQRLQFSSVSLSSAARSLQVEQGELGEGELRQGLDKQARLEISILKLMVEQLTGRRIKLFDPAELEPDAGNKAKEAEDRPPVEGAPGAEGNGFGLRYDYHHSHYESEQMRFSAKGVVRTEDGKEITFDADLAMSREFYTETKVSLRAGEALKDPLVINFDGKAAELTERNFSFDIDLDGHADQVAFVKSGSGFLALDRNADGAVNDGSELFGPSTGNGFSELARFDEDGNQWIDANDSVYDRLRIWTRDSQGNEHLLGLGAHDVGAIYLGHVATPFELNDADNQQLGQVRSSGVFLEESGEVGTVQQVDLVV